MKRLNDNHIRILAAGFVPAELAELAKLQSVDSMTGANLLGRKPTAREDVSGLHFPYFYPENNSPREHRIRLDNPQTDHNGKTTAKYLGSFGAKPKIYFPPGVALAMLADVNLPIVVCEGEKKLLALWRVATNDLTESPRFLPLALQGVWNWRERHKNTKREMADFHSISWEGRKITILFDADVAENYQVASAQKRLAKHLKSKSTKVFICSMPKVENHKGIDDLLGRWERGQDTVTAIKKCLELLETSKEFESNKFYLTNDLILDFANGGRGKTKLTVFRENKILHVDEIGLNKAKERENFIDALGLFDNAETASVKNCLMQLSMIKPQNETQETATIEKLVLSEVLSDGRIIEALSTGQFAIYTPETDLVEYAESVIFDNVKYLPLTDDITKDGLLVDAVEGYSNETELVHEIESYISRHYDLDQRELKLSASYILLTYLVDSLFEIPYLHPQGASGSGKTRFGETIVSASYRPLIVFTATEASLFRMIDRYKPTVFIDEFNLQNSDDNQGIMQILNAGWSRLGKVRRCNDSGEVESFSPFGCKIIASLQKMQSDALESRCVAIQTKETKRTDLRFANVGQIQADALKLRRKLLMFRFRNLNRNFLAETVDAENELKNHHIRPRVIQKATPLFMLIKDEKLKKEFIELLKAETRINKELSKESFDFEVVNAIHEILFVSVDENEVELRDQYQCELENTLSPQIFYKVQTVDGETCEALTVENIVERLNAGKSEKEKIRNDRFGRTLAKRFNLETKKCWKRDEKLRKKTMVIFDSNKLATLFENYSLPISQNFTVATVATDVKCNEKNELSVATVNQKNAENKVTVATSNYNKTNSLNGLATVATVTFEKTDGNSKNANGRKTIEL